MNTLKGGDTDGVRRLVHSPGLPPAGRPAPATRNSPRAPGENDFDTHFDYIHYNPVKHQLVRCPSDWEATSFHRWVRAGVYEPDWACGRYPPPVFPVMKDNYGEPK